MKGRGGDGTVSRGQSQESNPDEWVMAQCPIQKTSHVTCLSQSHISSCPIALDAWFVCQWWGTIFFHWCSVDMKDNGLQWLLIIAVENSLLGDTQRDHIIPSSWLWFKTLVWLVFGRSDRKNLLSEFSVMLICAPMALKHFISCQVYLSRSWYFSVVSAVWGLLHSCWKALPSLKLAF